MPERLDYGNLPDLTGHLLRLAHLVAQRQFTSEFGDTITSLQYGALELIMHNPGIRHHALAEALRTSKTVLTTSLKAVVAQGYVRASREDRDGRIVAYSLTEAGTAHCLAVRAGTAKVEAGLTGRLSGEEKAELNRLLRRLAGFM